MRTSRNTKWLLLLLLLLLIANFKNYQNVNMDLSDPMNRISSSVHIDDNKNEDAWIQHVTDEFVQVQIVDTKTIIKFRPPKEKIHIFKEGSIAAITFVCDKGFNDQCDLSESFQLYANNTKVELLAMKKKGQGVVKF